MKIKQPNFWYAKSLHPLAYFLLPFSCLFGFIIAIRRRFYQSRFYKIRKFAMPLIVVGNITIGGTGKTPFVIWLAHFLRAQGYQPGIVSRGVGGRQQIMPRQVSVDDKVAEVGDEALLLLANANCPVVIGVDRVKAVEYLLQQNACDVVISDDGLQHYRLARSFEIVMVDAERGLGNQCLLPAGPLREPVHRLDQADMVIYTGGVFPQTNSAAFAMTLTPMHCISLNDAKRSMTFAELRQPVHAVAGIGHPQRFFRALKQAGLKIEEHVFPDHHLYQAADFAGLSSCPILMTEKDAVKCRDFSDERFWYSAVKTTVDAGVEQVLLNKLREWSEGNEK